MVRTTGKNPTPQPPPRNGEGEKDNCSPSPLRGGGWGVGFWTTVRCCLALCVSLLLPPVGGAAPPHPDRETIRERLDDIYSRPAFRRGDDSPGWFRRQFQALLDWLSSLRGTAPLLYWLLLCLCAAALGALLFAVSRKVRRAFFVGDAARQTAATRAERRQLSRTYEEEARRRADAGEFTEAVRFLFLALVYRFDERGRVLFRQSFTNREYLELFADRPTVAEGLRVFVDALDDHWYGQRPTDEQQYQRCLALFRTLAGQGG